MKGETFEVELQATGAKAATMSGMYFIDGAKTLSKASYTVVNLEQPNAVWYVKEEGATPIKMAESVAKGQGSQLVSKGDDKYVITKLTPAELARQGMIDVHDRIEQPMRHLFVDKILVSKPLYPTSAQFDNSPRASPDYPTKEYPHFKSKKITYGPKGEAAADFELHNRLPVRVRGTFTHTRCAEGRKIEAAMLAAKMNTPNDINPGLDLVTVP